MSENISVWPWNDLVDLYQGSDVRCPRCEELISPPSRESGQAVSLTIQNGAESSIFDGYEKICWLATNEEERRVYHAHCGAELKQAQPDTPIEKICAFQDQGKIEGGARFFRDVDAQWRTVKCFPE